MEVGPQTKGGAIVGVWGWGGIGSSSPAMSAGPTQDCAKSGGASAGAARLSGINCNACTPAAKAATVSSGRKTSKWNPSEFDVQLITWPRTLAGLPRTRETPRSGGGAPGWSRRPKIEPDAESLHEPTDVHLTGPAPRIASPLPQLDNREATTRRGLSRDRQRRAAPENTPNGERSRRADRPCAPDRGRSGHVGVGVERMGSA